MGVRFMRRAIVARGNVGDAMEWASRIAAHWGETYGTTLTWGLEAGGEWGAMYWFADHENMAALESEMMASMGNQETSKLLAEGTDLFTGTTQDRIIMTM